MNQQQDSRESTSQSLANITLLQTNIQKSEIVRNITHLLVHGGSYVLGTLLRRQKLVDLRGEKAPTGGRVKLRREKRHKDKECKCMGGGSHWISTSHTATTWSYSCLPLLI